MAKVQGPLMSFDASGTVAGTATFAKWKGRNYVRNRVTPANPQTPAQTGVRASLAGLVQLWKLNVTALTSAFQTLADQRQISPFNAFVGFNQKRLSQALYAANVPNPGNAPPGANATGLAAAVSLKYVTLTWVDSAYPSAWQTLIYRKLGSDPTGLNNELIGAIANGIQVFVDGPLLAGTWHYAVAAVNEDGGRFALSTAVTAVVT